MKRVVVVAVFLAVTVVHAFATEVWQGDMFVTAKTAACDADGVDVGDFMRAVYRPRNVEDNGVDTKLALYGSRSAHRYKVVNAALSGAGPYEGDKIGPTALTSAWSATFVNTSVAPALPTPNTQSVVIKVTFRNFGDLVGCTATLKGSLWNRPSL